MGPEAVIILRRFLFPVVSAEFRQHVSFRFLS
jgi:hypothetical protein